MTHKLSFHSTLKTEVAYESSSILVVLVALGTHVVHLHILLPHTEISWNTRDFQSVYKVHISEGKQKKGCLVKTRCHSCKMDGINGLLRLKFITYYEQISCAFLNDACTKMTLSKQNKFLIYDFHIQLSNVLRAILCAGNSCHILDSHVKAHSMPKEELSNSAWVDSS